MDNQDTVDALASLSARYKPAIKSPLVTGYVLPEDGDEPFAFTDLHVVVQEEDGSRWATHVTPDEFAVMVVQLGRLRCKNWDELDGAEFMPLGIYMNGVITELSYDPLLVRGARTPISSCRVSIWIHRTDMYVARTPGHGFTSAFPRHSGKYYGMR